MQFSLICLSALAATAAAAPAGKLNAAALQQRAGCDVSKLSPPAAPTALPAPQGALKMVLVGTGTQNYTCADGNEGTIPAATGALATLHDASCVAAINQDMLNKITAAASKAPAGVLNNLLVAGHHYFSAPNVPTFDINSIGSSNTKKDSASNAPNAADVPWLFLTGTSGPAKSVYRLETAGGVAPANCAGKQAGEFTVPYAAQYWIYT